MKRSTCLSALLVGLSLTTASVALAAPPPPTEAANDKQPVKVAKANTAAAQPSDDSTTPPPTATPPPSTAAPEETAPATPAVSVGTTPTTPAAADTPATSAAEPTKKEKPRAFAGSSIYLTQSMTTNTVFKGQTQYNDPTAEGNIWLLPRFAINEAFQLRGRLIISYEETNSDTTTYKNEPQLSDTTLQLFYRKIPKFAGIQPAVSANVSLPTGKISQAKTLIFSPGLSAQLSRAFEHVLGGEFDAVAGLTYSHPIYSSRNPEVKEDRPYPLQCVGGGGCSDLLSGTQNTSDSLSYLVIVSQEWGKWNPAIMYLGASAWAYHPKEVLNPIDGTPVSRPQGVTTTALRQTHYISAWLDYNFTSWITGEVGYWNAISGLDESGQRANVIFDRYQDTRVYLGASIQIDNLVKELQGGNQGEGGVVRAKAQKVPFFTF